MVLVGLMLTELDPWVEEEMVAMDAEGGGSPLSPPSVTFGVLQLLCF